MKEEEGLPLQQIKDAGGGGGGRHAIIQIFFLFLRYQISKN